MNTKFKTVKQIENYVNKIHKVFEKNKIKFPEISGGSVNITDLDIDLIYKVYDYINKGKTKSIYENSTDKINHSNDRLNLWVWGKFKVMTHLSSVEVVKDCDCIERKEFKPKEVKETV